MTDLITTFDNVVEEIKKSNGEKTLQIKTFGRVWKNISDDFPYARECVQRYRYPDKVSISAVEQGQVLSPRRYKPVSKLNKEEIYQTLLELNDGNETYTDINSDRELILQEFYMVRAIDRFHKLNFKLALDTKTNKEENEEKKENL